MTSDICDQPSHVSSHAMVQHHTLYEVLCVLKNPEAIENSDKLRVIILSEVFLGYVWSVFCMILNLWVLRRCIPCDSSSIVFTVEVASGGHVADSVVGELQILGENICMNLDSPKFFFFWNLIFSDLLRIHEFFVFLFFLYNEVFPKNSAETDGRSLRLWMLTRHPWEKICCSYFSRLDQGVLQWMSLGSMMSCRT